MTSDVNPVMVGQICNIVNSELRGSLGTGVKSETTIFLQGRYRKVQNRLGETTGEQRRRNYG